MALDHRSEGSIELLLKCARSQGEFLVEHGRRIVPFSNLDAEDHRQSPVLLYEAGIVEPVSWDETSFGKIKRIRRADLSRLAAQALVHANLLPRCFAPVLVANDLLDGWLHAAQDDDGILLDEFRAWLDCGGLEADCLPNEHVSERVLLDEDRTPSSPIVGVGGWYLPASESVFTDGSRKLQLA